MREAQAEAAGTHAHADQLSAALKKAREILKKGKITLDEDGERVRLPTQLPPPSSLTAVLRCRFWTRSACSGKPIALRWRRCLLV